MTKKVKPTTRMIATFFAFDWNVGDTVFAIPEPMDFCRLMVLILVVIIFFVIE